MQSRSSKNDALVGHKRFIIEGLGKAFPLRTFAQYLQGATPLETQIIFLSGIGSDYLPNTILLSVVAPKLLCNIEIKKALEAKNIIVSVGSACNTANPNASHIILEMGADERIRKGTLRISLGDGTIRRDVEIFLREFINIVRSVTAKS